MTRPRCQWCGDPVIFAPASPSSLVPPLCESCARAALREDEYRAREAKRLGKRPTTKKDKTP